MSDKSRGSAGQKRAAKAKKRAQKNQGTVVSLADRSRRTAVDEYQRLIPIFHAWLLDSGISTGVEMAAAHAVGVGRAVDLLAQDTIRFSATAWRTSAIDHLLRAACGSPVLTVGNTDQQFPSAELDTTALIAAPEPVDWSEPDQFDIAAAVEGPDQWSGEHSGRVYVSVHVDCR
ncbi:hypothetical protein RCF27_23520 [Rhodococcus pyridinivorans]|uniref:hypothetical protein n=1 Tax=Rhodococcus pyridinivorans TaxID=103816 RepID=UPI000AE125ED|nr:hypothetical protein [Rhodococcus pyridinivorans]WMM72732.1 hypothetical protein RCF27_23520 [Rhodococcus pyridinivorans]